MIKDFLKNKKAVLFDLDGTLVDSMWMWPQIDVEFLGRFGYDCPGDLERAVEGMSFSETAAYFKERFSLPMTLEEIKECWSQMAMDKYRTQVPLKPGALEFLRYCKDQGIAAGIATSMAFIMVTSSPTNVIPYSSGYFRISEFAKSGVVMTIIGILAVTASVAIFGRFANMNIW